MWLLWRSPLSLPNQVSPEKSQGTTKNKWLQSCGNTSLLAQGLLKSSNQTASEKRGTHLIEIKPSLTLRDKIYQMSLNQTQSHMPLLWFLKRKMDHSEVQMVHFPTQSNSHWSQTTINEDSSLQTDMSQGYRYLTSMHCNRIDRFAHHLTLPMELPEDQVSPISVSRLLGSLFLNNWLHSKEFYIYK